jgi:hypothetical protein
MTHGNILIRIFGEKGYDSGPHLFEKCFVIMELSILMIAFPGFGIGHVQKVLNFGKYLHDRIRHNAHTTSSGRV